MRLSRITAAAVALACLIAPSAAQNVPGTNYSSTIAVTNTFQEVFVGANQSLNNCTIQNTGANQMRVYWVRPNVTPADTPTIAKSQTLDPGQPVRCGDAAITLVNRPWITGTSGDTYYAERY